VTPAEAGRKALHVTLSLGAAAVVGWLDPMTAAVILAAATFVALAVELGRRLSGRLAGAFRRLGPMLKNGEAAGLTGATTLSIGFTTAAVLFPGAPALAGILFTGLADPAAAVAGRRWGRIRYPGGKSVAGSGTFLMVVLALGLALGLPPRVVLVAGLLVTVAEAFSLPIDDNGYLPVLGAAAVSAASWLAAV
jgi:dolichol kinase